MLQTHPLKVDPKQNGGSKKIKTFDFLRLHHFVLELHFDIRFQALCST
jgi:hypothetical protein